MTDASFKDVRFDTLTEVGQPIPAGVGVPEVFREGLNASWSRRAGRIVAAAQTVERSRGPWQDLGDALTQSILAASGIAGVMVEGQCGGLPILSWLQRVRAAGRPALATIDLAVVPSPVQGRGIPSCSFRVMQGAEGVHWIQAAWRVAEDNTFHAGCDLLLAGYDRAFSELDPRWTSLSVTQFMAALAGASAWLVPLDGYLGYVVGATSGTELHVLLERRSSTATE